MRANVMPCPCCNSNYVEESTEDSLTIIICRNCGVRTSGEETFDAAKVVWDSRPNENLSETFRVKFKSEEKEVSAYVSADDMDEAMCKVKQMLHLEKCDILEISHLKNDLIIV